MGYYTTPKGLETLKKHKYSCKNDSLLYNYVMPHWWNFALKAVPLWVAPNLITLTGTLGLVLNLFLVWTYTENYKISDDTPWWVFVSCGISLFAYSTLDNLDGRQARRTGSSSQLGELFDHGCDAVVTTIECIAVGVVGQFGLGFPVALQFSLSWLTFWFATWEEYHTNILHLGFISGPEEGVHSLIFFFLTTAYTGPQFWQRDGAEVFGIQMFQGYKLNFFVMASILTIAVITCLLQLRKVLNQVQREGKSIWEAVKQLLIAAFFIGLFNLWFQVDPTLIYKYPFAVLLTAGLVFGEMVSRLILAHLCEEIYAFPRPLLPLIGMVLYVVTPLSAFLGNSEMVLFFWVCATLISYFHFAVGVNNELTAFLNISTFTIPYKKV